MDLPDVVGVGAGTGPLASTEGATFAGGCSLGVVADIKVADVVVVVVVIVVVVVASLAIAFNVVRPISGRLCLCVLCVCRPSVRR